MIYKLLFILARATLRVGHTLDSWAHAAQRRAMLDRFPVGTTVRFTCDCCSSAEDRQRAWYVLDFTDAGDFRLARPGWSISEPIDSTAYVYPGHLERAS